MADPRTLAQNQQRYPVRADAAAEAAVAPLLAWQGWVTVEWAGAYFGPAAAAPTEASGVALTLQWGQASEGAQKSHIRHASFRLACCAWKPDSGKGDDFPWFEPDEAPDEILAATAELALHYLREPERRFEVVGAESERDVAGNSFGFRYAWARNFYGDLPATTLGMIQRWIDAPRPDRAVKIAPAATARLSTLRAQPGWGLRKIGGP